MNAKKIMGAVLVALLAAALFVGAGAADETGKGTIFLYQTGVTGNGITAGTYQCGDSSIVITSTGDVTTGDVSKFVNGGKYSNGKDYFIVVLPNAAITALGGTSPDQYDAMAIGLISGDDIQFTASPETTVGSYPVAAWIVYDQDKNPTRYDVGTTYTDVTVSGTDLILSGAAAPAVKGTWGIQAVLDGNTGFVAGTDSGYLYGKIYEFAVLGATPEITASADTVIVNNNIFVTITGAPNGQYFLDADGFTIASNQVAPAGAIDTTTYAAVTESGQAVVTLSNGGKLNVYLTAGTDDAKKTIILKEFDGTKAGDKLSSVSVTIVEGAITGESEKDAYYYGNTIVLSGTTTAGTNLNYFIEGQNFAFQPITSGAVEDEDAENGKWFVELDSGAIVDARNAKSGLVPGNTYTIVVTTNSAAGTIGADMKQKVMTGAYATIAVTIAQPFITDVEAAATAIQGEKYTITGTAIAANDVILYVFGTSYFAVKKVTTDEEAFKFTLTEADTSEMGQGTYFYLIQHPMNDGLFNVWNGTGKLGYTALNKPATADDADFFYAATGAVNETFIFNAWTRGTSYAAQGLLEKIAGQDIDDIFVQGTFEVKPQELEINPIPAEVAQGDKLTVSGTSNSGKGSEIIINVRAGTFGATVKGDGTEGVFLTERAVTKEDGTWEAAIDTSKLSLGEYEVAVLLGGVEYDNADVKIVDKAPVTPVDPVDPVDPKPVDPVTPTEPETPGFGALAALAGLGAVAVLLLRRE